MSLFASSREHIGYRCLAVLLPVVVLAVFLLVVVLFISSMPHGAVEEEVSYRDRYVHTTTGDSVEVTAVTTRRAFCTLENSRVRDLQQGSICLSGWGRDRIVLFAPLTREVRFDALELDVFVETYTFLGAYAPKP